MKKAFKLLLALFFIILIVISALTISFYFITKDYKLNDKKLIDVNSAIEIYDKNDNLIETVSFNTPVTGLNKLNKHTIDAFVCTEDKRFFNHNGIDYKGIVRATIQNFKSKSFKEGGSTISQQLIKNTHLTNEKTFKRKIVELKLTLALEKKYTKNQILECYLNTIYFGKNIYGIENASRYYFDKSAEDLCLEESALLAGLIKSPNKYSPEIDYNKSLNRRNTVLKLMLDNNKISKYDYDLAINKIIDVNKINNSVNYSKNIELCLAELNEISYEKPYVFCNSKIYTNFDSNIQQLLDNTLVNNNVKSNKKMILLDKNNFVLAYSADVLDFNRQPGSTIKPFVSYAPALEFGIINNLTKIDDIKTDFDGYKPKNYANKYYGQVSAEFALAKSLNIPAVKLLNDVGIDKTLNFLSGFNLNINQKDVGLSLALGSIKNGISLQKLTSLYGIFLNNGYYNNPKVIRKIVSNENQVLYTYNNLSTKICSVDTTFLLGEMLKQAVEYGTAKKMQYNNATIYAKTGTFGFENGNIDAYAISFTKDYILGTWFGNSDNTLLDNSVTGGTYPTLASLNVWENLYKNPSFTEIDIPDTIKKVKISKIEYENDNKFLLADPNSPTDEIIDCYFSSKYIPTSFSNYFTEPKANITSVNFEENKLKLNYKNSKYIYFKIFKSINGIRFEVFDSINSQNEEFIDQNIKKSTVYSYTVLPYSKINDKIIFGKEFLLGNYKSSTEIKLPNDWWID